MSAEQYGPLEQEPRSIRPPFNIRDDRNPLHRHGLTSDEWRREVRTYAAAALREPLEGVELGAYDERIIEWLAGWDIPTIGTVVSLLHRARRAGRDDED